MRSNTQKVLIVDDEEDLRDILASYIESIGYSYDEAENGRSALEKIEKESFSLILSDIHMPEMTGIQLLQKIREHKNPVPFIFISSYCANDTSIEAMKLGAYDYLEKPFKPSIVKALIKEAVESNNTPQIKKTIPIQATAYELSEIAEEAKRKNKALEKTKVKLGSNPDKLTEKQLSAVQFAEAALEQLEKTSHAIRNIKSKSHANNSWEISFLSRTVKNIFGAAHRAHDKNILNLSYTLSKSLESFKARSNVTEDQAKAIAFAHKTLALLMKALAKHETVDQVLNQATEEAIEKLKQLST